jgi:hypothetical protein
MCKARRTEASLRIHRVVVVVRACVLCCVRRGSDDQGVSNVRRFLLEWLSFTHRYVPVGLMECPDLSTKINLREPGVSILESVRID